MDVKRSSVNIFTAVAMTILLSSGPAASQEESRIYLGFTAGGSYPVLSNLSGELTDQGEDELGVGYSLGVSIGGTFFDRKMAAEAGFTVSRYPSFDYDNGRDDEYGEDFEGNVTHYGFAVAAKYCFRPGSRTFVPWAGLGVGYGTTNLVSGGGKLGQFTARAFVQLEHRISGHISFLAEASWVKSFGEELYSSPFIDGSNSEADKVYDSRGVPLEDSFSSYDLRAGVKIWLRKPGRF